MISMVRVDALEQLLAKQEIAEVLHRYAQAADRQDWQAVRACFHDDATDNHGPYSGNADGLVDWLRERHAALDHSLHFLGNMLIELDGDRAHAETYCLTFQRLRPGAESPGLF